MFNRKIKIKFVDFWQGFKETNNLFFNILNKYFDIEISDRPDILFFSCFGFEHLNYSCKKIFYTGENVKPDYRYCDFSFSFEDNSKKNFHLPHFVEFDHFFDFKNANNDIPEIKSFRNMKKSKFCSFMATNYKAKERIDFVKKLMEYKRVDCAGPVLYNMGEKNNLQERTKIDWRKEKLQIIQHYKFTIAFENFSTNNYVTEKIFQPLLVGSIPIYWGAPNIEEYFNPKCYINVNDFNSFEDVIEKIKEIDRNDDLYQSFFEEPAILPNSKIYNITEKTIYEKIIQVRNSSETAIGKKNIVRNKMQYFLLKIKKIKEKI